MMRALVNSIVPFVAIATGCVNWGTRPDDFLPARAPSGAQVAVRVNGESNDRVGELLAVDSAGITIRSGRVIRIAWSRVHAMDVDGVGHDYDVRAGEHVGAEKVARLKLLSRFPQGMQRLPITLDSLISDASRQTTRFADRRLAVAEGYRRVGADFPGMGEHWVNLPVLMHNRIDPATPTFLSYATIAGSPTLLGIGFIVVTHGDDAPVDVPGWPSEWHEHSGLLSEESGARIGPARPDSPTHVWVMHVWTCLENPNGQLAADNWSLPFRRAGVAPPVSIDPDAGRAASLAVGGDAYLRALLTDAALRTPANSPLVDAAIDSARSRAATALGADANVAALRDAWASLSTSLERVLGPGVREILSPVHSHAHDGADR